MLAAALRAVTIKEMWWRAIGWVRLFGKWFGCNGEFVSAAGAGAGEGTGKG